MEEGGKQDGRKKERGRERYCKEGVWVDCDARIILNAGLKSCDCYITIAVIHMIITCPPCVHAFLQFVMDVGVEMVYLSNIEKYPIHIFIWNYLERERGEGGREGGRGEWRE